MKQAIEVLKKKVEEITEGLHTATVVHINREKEVIVSYEGKNLYAGTDQLQEIGDILLVDGSYQLPAKYEEVKMGLITPWNHNAVGVYRALSNEEAVLVQEYQKAISSLERVAKKDFSLRIEVETMLDDVNVELSEEQISDVVEDIELHETFLSVVGLYVVKGIENVAKRENIPFNEEEIEHKVMVNRKGINHSEL